MTTAIEPILTIQDAASNQLLRVYYPTFYWASYRIGVDPKIKDMTALVNCSMDTGFFLTDWLKIQNEPYYVGATAPLRPRSYAAKIYNGDVHQTVLINPNDIRETQVVSGMQLGLRDLFLTEGRHITGIVQPPRPDILKQIVENEFSNT